ncbi:MAG: hypothetical protein ABL958_18280, partial [Bdellovibrionia bacterium]
ETRNGCNGGNGGDGGNGGRASGGGDAGHGGNVTVTVDEKDLDLLMLIGHVSVSGGRGGSAGRHGNGGSGGSAGSGGSSYSWSEQVSDGRDEQGNTKYRTEYHHNSGGWNGSAGSAGRPGSGYVADGDNGRSGNFKIRVVTTAGTIDYGSRYDLVVTNFTLHSANNDGIFEPGESGYVDNIRVRNDGGMPTPPNQPVEISLPNGTWLQSKWSKLVITKSLQPREEIAVPGRLLFDLKDTTVQNSGDRLQARDAISPNATQTRVGREYGNFQRAKSFEVTFPIEITPIQTTVTLAAGQTAKLFWKVKNISQRDFGTLSDIKRQISTLLQVDPRSITTKEFEFHDSDGNPVSLDKGFFSSIAQLKAGEEVIIEGEITIKPNAIAYTKVGLKTDVKLGTIKDPGQARPVQFRDIIINISRSYRKTPGSQVLLLANNHSAREEIDAWTALLSKLGLVADIWDTTYEGFLEFNRILPDGTSLAKDFKGGTVVFLNNHRPLESDTSKQIQADAIVPKKDLLQTAAQSAINFYFVGADQRHYDEILSFFLLPSPLSVGTKFAPNTFETSKEFLNATAPDDATSVGRVGDIDLTENWYMRSPSREYLERKARDLQDKLNERFPDRRYFVVHDFDARSNTEKTVKDGWLRDNMHTGKLQVFQSLPATESSMTALGVTNEVMHTAEFVQSDKNAGALLTAMSTENKLKLYTAALAGKNNYGSLLEQTLLVDIATEQSYLRRTGVDGDFSNKMPVLTKVLNALGAIRGTTYAADKYGHWRGQWLLNFYARIDFLALAQSKWYWSWFNGSRLAPLSNNIFYASREKVMASVRKSFGENRPKYILGVHVGSLSAPKD